MKKKTVMHRYSLRLYRRQFAAAIIAIVITMSALAQSRMPYPDGKARWTPDTSVSMRYFYKNADKFAVPGWDTSGDGEYAVEPSPDGKHFFFISNTGDVTKDVRTAEIFVFAVKDVTDAIASGAAVPPKPVRTLKIEHPRFPLHDARWSKGQDGVINYLAPISSASTESGKFEFDVASGKKRLTTDLPDGQKLANMTYSSRKGTSIFTTQEGIPPSPDDRPIRSITPTEVFWFMSNFPQVEKTISRTFVQTQGQKPWQLRSGWAGNGFAAWLSPNGRYAVMLRIPDKPAAGWLRYDQKTDWKQITNGLPPEWMQYTLIDVAKKTEKPMLDAPMGAATSVGFGAIPANIYGPPTRRVLPQALWSMDGRSVVMVNTALPLGGPYDKERQSMAYIAAYDVATGKYEMLEPMKLPTGAKFKDIAWVKEGQELLVRHQTADGKPAEGTSYTYMNGKWQPKPAEASLSIPEETGQRSLPGGLKVEVRESANDPPAIVASMNGKELDLSGPDPALDNVWFARMETFKWKDGTGKEQTGGLMLPKEMPKDGSKIPLVIQSYYYQPELFHPDGPWTTAYAAQAMVAQGMAVLSIGMAGASQKEPPQKERISILRDWIDTLPAAVAEKYPIDLARVGAVGFSQSGIQLRHIVTDPGKLRLAAVVAADSFPLSYSVYLQQQAAAGKVGSFENVYGGQFYENKQEWLEKELTFNADRVMTPILFSDNNVNLAYVLDMIGAYKLAKRPFDYLVNREPTHALFGVISRKASMEATVDWMNFWLQGKETPRSYDPDRYVRWRAARELHKANLAEEAKNGGPKAQTTARSASKAGTASEAREIEKRRAREEMKAAGIVDNSELGQDLNTLAYKALYQDKDIDKALKYFRWNLALFTGTRVDAYINDSLAEGYLIAGDVTKTIEHYEAALRLNPQIPGPAKKIVERLKADPGSLAAIQEEMAKAYQGFVASQRKSQ